MEKIKVGVLGATGMVGQMYIKLLENHPWFEVSYVAASPRSAGKKYVDAVEGRLHMATEMPDNVRDLFVEDANNVEAAVGRCGFVFSALELDKEEIKKLEMRYAAAGISVVSNASAHRGTEDVPAVAGAGREADRSEDQGAPQRRRRTGAAPLHRAPWPRSGARHRV